MAETKLTNLAETSVSVVQPKEKPRAGMEIMFFGQYAPRYIKGRNEYTADNLFLLHMDNRVSPLILIADGKDNIRRTQELDLFHVYAPYLSIRQSGIAYKAKVAGASFPEVLNPTWLKEEFDERIQQVIRPFPHVPLLNIENHLSMVERNGKGFTDMTDIKGIEGLIDMIAYDTDVATLIVGDATRKGLAVQVSRIMLRKAQTGVGSSVKLIGTLEYNGYSTVMNACCILPIVRMPLVEPKERELNISAL